VLFTGGTLAWLAAEGHSVVIVVACAGGLGTGMNANPEARLAELRESASRLGAARVAHLGYADSGHGPVLFPDPPGQVRFARADLDEAAARLAALILAARPAAGAGHRPRRYAHFVQPGNGHHASR
jgi:LmbE family N-acetylglucosaminyl deacetylase